jgi:hypothetical protein
MRRYAPWLLAVLSSLAAIKGQFDLIELDLRLRLAQEKAALLQADNFGLATTCDRHEP